MHFSRVVGFLGIFSPSLHVQMACAASEEAIADSECYVADRGSAGRGLLQASVLAKPSYRNAKQDEAQAEHLTKQPTLAGPNRTVLPSTAISPPAKEFKELEALDGEQRKTDEHWHGEHHEHEDWMVLQFASLFVYCSLSVAIPILIIKKQKPGNKFGLASLALCLACPVVGPTGCLTICFPIDEDKVGQPVEAAQ